MEEREIKMKLAICRLQGLVGWCLLVLFSFVLISFSSRFFPPGVLRLLKAYINRDCRLFMSNLTKGLGPVWIKCLTLWQHLQKGLWLTPLENLHREVNSFEEAWGWGAGEGEEPVRRGSGWGSGEGEEQCPWESGLGTLGCREQVVGDVGSRVTWNRATWTEIVVRRRGSSLRRVCSWDRHRHQPAWATVGQLTI